MYVCFGLCWFELFGLSLGFRLPNGYELSTFLEGFVVIIVEEDSYLCKEMDHILWSTASARERNKGYISHKNVTDYVKSYRKYRLSPFDNIGARGYGYWIHEYEIGKAGGTVGSYYKFGEPVIDIDRVEQKLKEYKQHREEIRK